MSEDLQRQIQQGLRGRGFLRNDAWSASLKIGPLEHEFRVRAVVKESEPFGRNEFLVLQDASQWEPWALMLEARTARVEETGRNRVPIEGRTAIEISTRDAIDAKSKAAPAATTRRGHYISRVIPDGKRLVILTVACKGREPDAAAVQTFFDSFELR